MLIQRTITAIILGSLVIFGIFYLPTLGFDLFVSLLIILAVWEFSCLVTKNYQKKMIFLLVLVTTMLLIYTIAGTKATTPTLILGLVWWLLAPYFLWRYSTSKYNFFTGFFKQIILALVIFIPCWVSLITIRHKFGGELLLFLLAIIWAVDIGAYFTGKFWGKHLLAPKISPKKTVEGLLGGILTALIVAIIGILLLKFNLDILSIFSFLMLIIVACLWSVIGDLFESMLKRFAKVKDSGSLLPGHGGVYDRIDSLLAAMPIFTLGLLLM